MPTTQKPGSGRRSTLRDIATETGVSVSTVSAVLAGKATQRRISPDVVARVQQSATQSGFSPNRLVRSLQKGRTGILAFYSAYRNRWRGDLYMDQLNKAVELAAGTNSYDLLTLTHHDRSAEEIYAQINGGWADGLILFGARDGDPLLPLLERSHLPVVLFQRTSESTLPCVMADQTDGLRQLAEALVSQGHQRIAFLIGKGRVDTEGRLATLQQQLIAAGLSSQNLTTHTLERSKLALELPKVLAGPESPTALFCWNDHFGYAVLEVCDALGISVPGQLSVVGFDGIHWPSTSRHILTSVAVDLEAVAKAAITLLDELIVGTVSNESRQTIPVTLLPGTTLGPPSAH
ncbi:LacI family DNA-binding transcriptional regulator [Armatimonas sp.]|uniref:LacI family DNA-binding transcriptional regulator n=1 Tax=Armatimonas sp. TaxID=1872638 RepID=UPI00286C7D90|nr:LacI family DNA-binding transcriptional regulator [Armatimonas sp.]